MIRYMLDTNIVSHLVRKHATVARRVVETPLASLCISSITAGELLFGLAKAPDLARLHAAVGEFLQGVDVLPWQRSTVERYGLLRADLQRRGVTLGQLDMLIAAHALDVGAVLVTNDRAFAQVAALPLEDWTR